MGKVLLAAEVLFLVVFMVRAAFGRRLPGGTGAPQAQGTRTAPRARALLVFHAVGIVLVSLGINDAFAARGGTFPASLRVVVSVACLVAASTLAGWSLRVFRSWRLLARLDAGHRLCAEGPYKYVRHPIYLAVNLWAVGSALACPSPATLLGAVVVVMSNDLRGRAEEQLLETVFGEQYRTYSARTRRLLPGIY
jgi:protein-S-isoprenylcysteine O-methyltransferase Ste14